MIAKCPYCNAEMEGDAAVGDFVECPICKATFTLDQKHVVLNKVAPKVVRTARRRKPIDTYRPPSGIDKYMPSEKPSRHHEHLPALFVVVLIIGAGVFFIWKVKQNGQAGIGNTAYSSFPSNGRTDSSDLSQTYDPVLGLMIPKLRHLAAYSYEVGHIQALVQDEMKSRMGRPSLPPQQKREICQRLRDKGIVRQDSRERMLFHAVPNGAVFYVSDVRIPNFPQGTICLDLVLVDVDEWDDDSEEVRNVNNALWKKQNEVWSKAFRNVCAPGWNTGFSMIIRRSPKVDADVGKINKKAEDDDIFLVSKNWVVGLRVSQNGGETRMNWLDPGYELYPSEEEAMALMGMRSSPPDVTFQTMDPPSYE